MKDLDIQVKAFDPLFFKSLWSRLETIPVPQDLWFGRTYYLGEEPIACIGVFRIGADYILIAYKEEVRIPLRQTYKYFGDFLAAIKNRMPTEALFSQTKFTEVEKVLRRFGFFKLGQRGNDSVFVKEVRYGRSMAADLV